MTPGDPIRKETPPPHNRVFFAAFLPAGKRAVGVRISAENTAGGFILPNDRVDVIHTDDPSGGGGGLINRTILRKVPVLAIDQNVAEKKKDGKGQGTCLCKTPTTERD